MKKDIWFKAKRYGWGWTPCNYKGWLVILVWAILFAFSVTNFDHEWLKNLIFVLVITAILIWVSWKKGEKPGWRWGK